MAVVTNVLALIQTQRQLYSSLAQSLLANGLTANNSQNIAFAAINTLITNNQADIVTTMNAAAFVDKLTQ